MTKKNVVHVGYFHKGDDARILKKECISLYNTKKYNVTYITSNRNDNRTNFIYEGIKVKIIPLVNKRFIRLFKYINDLYNEIMDTDVDICHIHEFILLPLVSKLKRNNIKVIIDLHENDVEDRAEQAGNILGNFLGRIVRRILIAYEKSKIKKADGVISVTPQIINRVEQYGTYTILLPNYPIVNVENTLNINENDNENTVICFAGGISDLWNIKTILESVAEIPNVEFYLAGRSESEYLAQMNDMSGWKKTKFFGVVPQEEVYKEIYSKSNIGMALLSFGSGWLGTEGTLGNTKMYEYMQASIPVIGSRFKYWGDIIDANQCGILVDPNNRDEITNAISFLKNNPQLARIMGQNGKTAILQKYNWGLIQKRLIDLYDKII